MQRHRFAMMSSRRSPEGASTLPSGTTRTRFSPPRQGSREPTACAIRLTWSCTCYGLRRSTGWGKRRGSTWMKHASRPFSSLAFNLRALQSSRRDLPGVLNPIDTHHPFHPSLRDLSFARSGILGRPTFTHTGRASRLTRYIRKGPVGLTCEGAGRARVDPAAACRSTRSSRKASSCCADAIPCMAGAYCVAIKFCSIAPIWVITSCCMAERQACSGKESTCLASGALRSPGDGALPSDPALTRPLHNLACAYSFGHPFQPHPFFEEITQTRRTKARSPSSSFARPSRAAASPCKPSVPS